MVESINILKPICKKCRAILYIQLSLFGNKSPKYYCGQCHKMYKKADFLYISRADRKQQTPICTGIPGRCKTDEDICTCDKCIAYNTHSQKEYEKPICTGYPEQCNDLRCPNPKCILHETYITVFQDEY